jgi:dTDP-4-dehydrorhamnose 3,5-epimerase
MSNAALEIKEHSMSPSEKIIFGVEIKQLKTHRDQRGFFREVIRVNDQFFQEASNFGQWSHSLMQRNVVKAWHYHHIQTDWWYIAKGQIEAVLYDNREESPTYKQKMLIYMGDANSGNSKFQEVCVKIPPGVLHGLKVLSDDAHLFYITSHTYNSNEEGRFAYNSSIVGHNWGEDANVAENDKKDFVPTSIRVPVK